MTRKRKPTAKRVRQSDCTIPPPMELSLMPDYHFGSLGYSARRIQEYVEWQAKGEKVSFLEKVKTEPLLGRKMDVWNVRTNKNAWWVITNPTNLYSQQLFPSMDYTISFHVGVSARMMENHRAEAGPSQRRRILSAVVRFEEATKELDLAEEPEDVQAVGMRLRECLLEFIQIVSDTRMVPAGQTAPKRADFLNWAELLANFIAPGSSADETRSALKAAARSAWQFSNWLTHARNATCSDGKLGVELVRTVIGAFWTAIDRAESGAPSRCPRCNSFRIESDYRPDLGIEPPYIKVCQRCDWVEPEQVPSDKAKAANHSPR